MLVSKLHDGEVDIGIDLARHLVHTQFPAWSDLRLTHVESSGTVNVLFRLGPDMVLRLPRLEQWQHVAREFEWLPRLGAHVPVPIPEPVAEGRPDERYPLRWTIYGWIEGDTLDPDSDFDEGTLVDDLLRFIRACWDFPAPDGPQASCASPVARDAATRRSIHHMADELDVGATIELWERACGATPFSGTPVWIHGDLFPGNLLVRDGRLAGVIDFGDAGLGDPACDLLPAWSVLTAATRDGFRHGLDVDDATWSRGRAMAFSKAMLAIPYYRESNEVFANVARRTFEQVAGDMARSA